MGRPAAPAAIQDNVAVHLFNEVQAHSASSGFFAAGIMGLVGVVAALVLINVKKSDLPTNPNDLAEVVRRMLVYSEAKT